MAVALEFINLLIPTRIIEDRYPGGLDACIDDHWHLLGKRIWYDDHLLRDGALTPQDMRKLVEGWALVGLQPLARSDGRWRWQDMCVLDCASGAPTLPCPWLDYYRTLQRASLRGVTDRGCVGRSSVPATWRRGWTQQALWGPTAASPARN